MKKFKTFEEQLEIMRSRNIIFTNESDVIDFLAHENYYKIINGYKDLFLVNNGRQEDKYKIDTYFDDIKNLFLFDRKLSNVIFEYSLVFENNFKTQVAYEFSKNHPEEYAYLNPNNFIKSNHRDVLKLISILANSIANDSNAGPISHYINKYSSVPLWVLVGFLTFGNVLKFHEVMNISEQNSVAKFFSDNYQTNYETFVKIEFSDFISIVRYINGVRNLCAHGNRIYNSELTVRISSLFRSHAFLDFNGRNVRIVAIFVIFRAFLSKDSYQEFYQKIESLFAEYKGKFKSIQFEKILNEMGMQNEEAFSKLKLN